MKKLSFLAIITLLIVSCSKKTTTPNSEKLNGKWEWINSVGGFTGIDTIKPIPDSTVTITFKDNMTYSTSLNRHIIATGNYQLLNKDNQKILLIKNFTPIEGLYLGINGSQIKFEDNRLYLMDFEVSEPYTHKFILLTLL